ncbi:molybdenum cofactor guanylyltransferase [Acaryochloris marina]|uniref:Probable molybdenum cofactor guanylyltransferase n=1 Tax=Acaryochloris marina (strain MBIC 11017) TaxID=329726 RepID=B0CEW7_ACAM1|nr:molybdenum cofactor guanylyltransferase [Acaryochloris marina]ABW29364.1 molybdopterin-guanine dinucleotide biosynthesis protein A, putative [Acaryochloris marina MBIC11017]BDM78281.1 molybdenum cofactor guanylyltransferase [Acaryochloris marina MBIC10699]
MNQPTSLTQQNYIVGLVLAGGRSRRMGSDKALLCWQGVPMLQRVCRAALQCCDLVHVLTPWPERYQPVIPSSCIVLREHPPDQGPLVALLAGLNQLQTTWVLLLACDLPLLRPDILREWLALLPNTQALALVPHQPEQWQPLCGFYHYQSRSSLQSFIQQGGQSFQDWLSRLPAQKIAIDTQSQAMLWNCNTPHDLIPPEV